MKASLIVEHLGLGWDHCLKYARANGLGLDHIFEYNVALAFVPRPMLVSLR